MKNIKVSNEVYDYFMEAKVVFQCDKKRMLRDSQALEILLNKCRGEGFF